MPRLPIDYSKTIIYKIVCNDLNICDVYVGSTTDFVRRKGQHKQSCNNEKSKKYNRKVYQTIRANGGWDNFSMVEIEKYPCNDSNEARTRERHYYELLNASLNMICPIRSGKEYYEDNKEKILDQCKHYREANKEKIIERQKEYTESNKEKIRERRQQYRISNKEQLNEKAKQYREANKEKINEKQRLKREAKKQN